MTSSKFGFFTSDQIDLLRTKVFDLLENHGVKLDPHPEMFDALTRAKFIVDSKTSVVRFPKTPMQRSIDQAPKSFILGARAKSRVLPLPRPDGTFYTRSNTGAHGWIDPKTDQYRKTISKDLTDWAKLINRLDDIDFIPYLFCDDVPNETADIHGLSILLRNTDKHIWVQPYSAPSVEYLIKLSVAAAGGRDALKNNPVISMIACSLSPRSFKQMDLEVILQCAKASLPIHACSLPSAGGTGPITMPSVIVMATAEILAMLAMAQAVQPGTPVIACPIIFSTDMRTGRSLQSSVEALKGASGAIQFIKAAFKLPTHNYGSGSDSPVVDGQSMSERAILSSLMSLSGSDILGGAGQMEVATAVSPIQLIIDNEVLGMVRHIARGLEIDEDNLAWDVLTKGEPGTHFLTSHHTLRHCRDAFTPRTFSRLTREAWERQGSKAFLDRVIEHYNELMTEANACTMDDEQAHEIEAVLKEAEERLIV